MYEKLLRPILFRFSSDWVHDFTIKTASIASKSSFICSLIQNASDTMFRKQLSTGILVDEVQKYRVETNTETETDTSRFGPSLAQHLLGLSFRNPIGLAAGFDKNGVLPNLFHALGFGFEEVGSITANSSRGNPVPRSFRLPEDNSLINRMGLNNEGAQRIINRLSSLSSFEAFPIGINIAKTHDPAILGEDGIQDYLVSYRYAEPVADYITLNISCPNTTEGKTFEEPGALDNLLSALPIQSSLPVLIKFSPDLSRDQLNELLTVTDSYPIAGYVATNTSSGRDGLTTNPDVLTAIGRGGLSGKAIRKKSTQLIQWIHEERPDKPIIGVGGIETLDDIIEKLEAGASLLQFYTALVYHGPFIAAKLNGQLLHYMYQRGYQSIQDFHNSGTES